MHLAAGENEQSIKEDLKSQSLLKLEIASFFGRSTNFFSAMK